MNNLRRIGLAIILVQLVIVSVWLIRVAFVAQSLRTHLTQLQALTTQSDLGSACDVISATHVDVAALNRETGRLVSLAPILSWLPGVGDDLRAAPHLLTAADALSQAGALVCATFAQSDVRTVSLAGIMRAFADDQPNIQHAADAATRAERALTQVQSESLSPRWSSQIAFVQRNVPFLRAALQFASLAPTLGGFDRPRTYLILVVNEDELRPGGGFITGVGEVQIQAGQIAAMQFRDSYTVDDFTQPYPEPPRPLASMMGIEQWVFRDSNWSPDFPTAARQAIDLYRPGGASPKFDGVIALDQRAVQELIAAIGPLPVPDSREPITGANVIAYIRRAWAPTDGNFTRTWLLNRKSFMTPLADAARKRLDAGAFEKIPLAQTVLRLIDGKHMQVFIDQPKAAAILQERGWDGALRRAAGDYLMVVDANLGYNKVNARVRQSINYRVDLRAAPPRGELTLVYTNTATVNYPCRPEARFDPTYEQMMERCYWNYVRVYAPVSARLDDATQIAIPATALWNKLADPGKVIARAADEGNFMSLEAPMVLPTGSAQKRVYALTLPMDVIEWNGNEGRYTLLIQKQAGAQNIPVALQIDLPLATRLVEASPKANEGGENRVIYRALLDRDLEFRLRFARSR